MKEEQETEEKYAPERVGSLLEDIRQLSKLEKECGYTLEGDKSYVIAKKYVPEREVWINIALTYSNPDKSYLISIIITDKSNKEYFGPVKELDCAVIKCLENLGSEAERILKELKPETLRGLSRKLKNLEEK